MTERKIYAEITLDDDAAIEEGMGSIDYVEREFGWLLDSGITLENAIIADDDDSDTWARYVNYVINWAKGTRIQVQRKTMGNRVSGGNRACIS